MAAPEARRYMRNPAISETAVDDELFLVEPESQEVFYLDTVSSGLWRLLAEPQTTDTVVSLFAAAFPDTVRADIERDVAAALAEMKRRGLVVMVS
jgi:hypothetical protein